ncbi:hypothetical protein QQS21_005923 [Conoideocrella luteorostrata]|uniref:Developmental regulatory protein wetA n=1 Tax=Conoideocrella luteorostrata TaxID=1105319 RepID=A0AAJ0CPI4_9HYPO|nr:hypothetical protein QQS21_005923 [Conoideocrella luteorostrata]
MYWEDINSASTDDPANDFFGQFVDFDSNGNSNDLAVDGYNPLATTMSGMPNSIMLLGNHGTKLDSTVSSGVSSGDEFDFLSCSSNIGATASAASHEIDPKDLALSTHELFATHSSQQPFEYLGRASMSEADLTRLESISLHSPQKPKVAASDPSSPTPPNTDVRKPKKFVETISSTIKKATKIRKNKKTTETQQQPLSPKQEPQQSLKLPKQRRGKTKAVTPGNLPASPPIQQQEQAANFHFIHGHYEDPFGDGGALLPPQGVNLQYYGQVAPDTPVESPGVKSEPGQGNFQADQAWKQQHIQWPGAGGEYVTSQEGGGGGGGGWWNSNMINHGHNEFTNPPLHNHQRSASIHVMGQGQGQNSGMNYDYGSMADTSTSGLMIHMPQPRGSQSTVVNDLTANAQTFLPPPPVPQAMGPAMPNSERSHRPPKAKSSGARHLSCSPVRKQRGTSASPTPTDQSAVPRSRHSSGASVSSARSSSGRLPGSMPGTPCSVRKRRSRDASGSSGGGASAGADSGGIGFVNFTPHDGSMLMTGVAPSGSSKTKARREKEAQDRRRRLSEAAIKAVAAAGGDVDKLIEQGFAF